MMGGEYALHFVGKKGSVVKFRGGPWGFDTVEEAFRAAAEEKPAKLGCAVLKCTPPGTLSRHDLLEYLLDKGVEFWIVGDAVDQRVDSDMTDFRRPQAILGCQGGRPVRTCLGSGGDRCGLARRESSDCTRPCGRERQIQDADSTEHSDEEGLEAAARISRHEASLTELVGGYPVVRDAMP